MTTDHQEGNVDRCFGTRKRLTAPPSGREYPCPGCPDCETASWMRTIERARRDAIWRREQFYGVLLAFMGPIVRVVGAVDRKLRWAEVRDQDWQRPRPAWRVWLTPRVAAVSSRLQRFTAKRVF